VPAVFDGLFLNRTLTVVEAALRSAGAAPDQPVAVIGNVRLGRALAERGRPVLVVDGDRKRLRRLKRGTPVLGDGAALPVAAGSLGAVIGLGAGGRDDWEAVLAEWSRAACDGGALVLVDRAPPAEMTKRALCAGLAEIEQRTAGRLVVTSGLVSTI
jgi:hypothetical protein